MSTLKVTSIQNPSTSSGGVSIDTSGHVTVDGVAMPSSGPLSNRNKIINGDMRIDQRNAGAAVTIPANAYTYSIDRWFGFCNQPSKFSLQQNAGAVTPPVGHSNYLGATSLSAYAVISTDYFALGQAIEGFNFADASWGTADAKTVTLSFQVYSSLTGTFGGAIQSSNQGRSYPFSYTVSSANTWTPIAITIAGDTTGTWVGATNGIGARVFWSLGSGSVQSGTAGAWVSGAPYSVTGATSVVGTNGATFYITGVQLEVGSVATPFEHRSYGDELARCQRYYYKIQPGQYDTFCLGYNRNTTLCQAFAPFPVTMRAAPTALETSGTASDYRILYLITAATCNAVPFFDHGSTTGSDIYFQVASGLTAGQGSKANSNTADAYLAWSAEL